MKNVAIDFHFIRDQVQLGAIQVAHISFEDQLADALTKPLPRQRMMERREIERGPINKHLEFRYKIEFKAINLKYICKLLRFEEFARECAIKTLSTKLTMYCGVRTKIPLCDGSKELIEGVFHSFLSTNDISLRVSYSHTSQQNGCPDTHHSTMGRCVFLGSNLLLECQEIEQKCGHNLSSYFKSYVPWNWRGVVFLKQPVFQASVFHVFIYQDSILRAGTKKKDHVWVSDAAENLNL
ncbi:hypothetical protein SADUNF_Sadunf18G0044400 [Salix dunnii]|uniref:Uncharacterized protein n=1 Tax=Salix dunnii TaxID=1413687 RepID=A0A835J3D9_9ROSI|nr:hypothetical protein SADUNF_Sadunf18G0044400 [Salix dunnii]